MCVPTLWTARVLMAADGCGGPANVQIHLAERRSVSHILRIPRRILAKGSVAASPRLSFVCTTLMLDSTG